MAPDNPAAKGERIENASISVDRSFLAQRRSTNLEPAARAQATDHMAPFGVAESAHNRGIENLHELGRTYYAVAHEIGSVWRDVG